MVQFGNKLHQFEPIRLQGPPVISKWFNKWLRARSERKGNRERNRVVNLMNEARRVYYNQFIEDNSTD